MKVTISEKAQDDLSEIQQYILEEFADEFAMRNTLDKIYDKIDILAGSPRLGRVYTEITPYLKRAREYRVSYAGNYALLFEARDDRLIIHRVVYARRDYPNLLPDEEDETPKPQN